MIKKVVIREVYGVKLVMIYQKIKQKYKKIQPGTFNIGNYFVTSEMSDACLFFILIFNLSSKSFPTSAPIIKTTAV